MSKAGKGTLILHAMPGQQHHQVERTNAKTRSKKGVEIVINQSVCTTRAEALAAIETAKMALENMDYPAG